MKVYLSGKMRGLPEFNYPMFNLYAAKLRLQGYTVTSPAELDNAEDLKWVDCMKRDIRLLLDLDAIAMIPGWENSLGGKLELLISFFMGLDIMKADTLEVYSKESSEELVVNVIRSLPKHFLELRGLV